MEGFKQSTKMQCFKEGGSVKYKSRHSEKSEMSEDIAQDKKIVKKAFKMHDDQLHESKKTDLKKLKKGGTVRRFEKASGQYGAKKNDADIKSIKEAKQFKPVKLCGGSSVKKMQMGGTPAMAPSAPVGQGAISDVEKMRLANRARNRAMLSPSQQKQLDAQEAAAAASAATGQGMMRRKGGGCVTKMKNGGSLKDVDAKKNPGLSKLPTNIRNKMGYKKAGGKACD